MPLGRRRTSRASLSLTLTQPFFSGLYRGLLNFGQLSLFSNLTIRGRKLGYSISSCLETYDSFPVCGLSCKPKPFCISDTTRCQWGGDIFARSYCRFATLFRVHRRTAGQRGEASRLEEKLCVESQRRYYNIGWAVVNEERTKGVKWKSALSVSQSESHWGLAAGDR